MAARTRATLAALTSLPPFTTRETVIAPTPHSRATSAIVGLPDGFRGMRSTDYQGCPVSWQLWWAPAGGPAGLDRSVWGLGPPFEGSVEGRVAISRISAALNPHPDALERLRRLREPGYPNRMRCSLRSARIVLPEFHDRRDDFT